MSEVTQLDLLARRARQLAARRGADAAADVSLKTVLTIRLNDERFALDVGAVAQVTPLGKLTPVPGAAAALLGVMALKGEVVGVFDLARVLGLPARDVIDHESAAAGYVLIMKHADARVGCLVTGVDQIAAGQVIGEVAGPGGPRRLIQIGKDRLVLIQDLERILAPLIHGDGQ